MRQIVNRFIKKHDLLFHGAKVVVGVSGGPDSLALLFFLKNEVKRWNLTLIAAHVDHSFRGDESAADLTFVQSFCFTHGIIFEGTKIDVKKYKKEHKLTVQVAARQCRYQFFEQAMKKHGANILALGHHGDDQVETILMRQVRGAYGLGLAGIQAKREFCSGTLIRPFLCVSKDDIIEYCKQENLVPRIDQSNFSGKYLRNRIRNEILPIMKKENPSVHQKFQQQSELMLEDEFFLLGLAEERIKEAIVKKSNKSVVLSISKFNRIPIPLQRRGFQLILNYLYDNNIPLISTIHIEEFVELLKSSHPSGTLHLPKGLSISKSYDQCTLTFLNKMSCESYQHHLTIPGMTNFKKGMIIAEVKNQLHKDHLSKHIIVCDLEKLSLPLVVRTRKNGDRIFLKGMNGSKKLKDLFINEKIDRNERNEWPILVDSNSEIIWVPSIRRSNLALPSDETKQFLLLSYIKDE